MPGMDKQVEVASPTASGLWAVVSLWLTWIACALWVVLGGGLLLVIPRFVEIFKQFDAKCPLLTAIVFNNYLELAGGCGVVVGLLVAKEWLCPDFGWRTRWNAIGFFAGVLFTGLVIASLFLSMIAIMQSLMGGGQH